MLTKRIIPCLDVMDGRVVKGTNFIDLKDAGGPVENAKAYEEQMADELCFLDITASHEARKTIVQVVEEVAAEVFMPLTVGGGIRGLDDIREILLAGADKVTINTAAVEDARYHKPGERDVREPVHLRRHRRKGEGRRLRGLHLRRAQAYGRRRGQSGRKGWRSSARGRSSSRAWTGTARR